jgi:hypothetical protein
VCYQLDDDVVAVVVGDAERRPKSTKTKKAPKPQAAWPKKAGAKRQEKGKRKGERQRQKQQEATRGKPIQETWQERCGQWGGMERKEGWRAVIVLAVALRGRSCAALCGVTVASTAP